MTVLNDCGCCDGLTVQTPVAVSNRPGLSAIAYRVGTHGQFKASMLTRLSAANLAELSKLKTRDDDDFTIALLDAWALISDILTFYQERIANESYLRTATERRSIIHLARLIGYELRPGVAASTWLAFTLENGAGAPASVPLLTGLKVQSVPGPGQKPQTYETVETIEARPEWNALKPQLTELVLPAFGDTHTYLAGVTTNLKPGDPLLIVGTDREEKTTSENWDIRRVSAVEPDATNKRTLVRWSEPLGNRLPHVEPSRKGPKVFAMRVHASLFGANAPLWTSLPVALRVGEAAPANDPSKPDPPFYAGAYAGRATSWAEQLLDKRTTSINLDAVYEQVIRGSWIVLVRPAHAEDKNISPAYAEVYKVTGVSQETKADFNISAKTTRLEISGENIDKFSPRLTTVYAQSEELQLAETPIDDPLQDNEIALDHVVNDLQQGRTLIVTGKRARAVIGATRSKLFLTTADSSQKVPLISGDNLRVVSFSSDPTKKGVPTQWRLLDKTGLEGSVTTPQEKVTFMPAAADDPFVSEVVHLDEATLSDDKNRTILTLANALTNTYDRNTVTIAANVAFSTHGETVKDEVLGSADAGKPYQSFTLKQAPLTFTPANSASGGQSTLEVRVNELKWSEVETLFGHGPRERIYITEIDDDAKTTVQFGDGITGARPPMGSENVTATYRKGIGLEGLVDAGQLSLLMTRPLGAKSVINPKASEGAQDPQQIEDARENSPITVLTLDRVVSLRDYEDFARAFSGIAKALATWSWTGHSRGVFLTIAGIDGAPVDDQSVLQTNLISALQNAGDAFVPIVVRGFNSVPFNVVAGIKVKPEYIADHVIAAIEKALRASFSFHARAFGQPVTLSEVFSVMQNVPGVVFVDIHYLHRSSAAQTRETFLPSFAPPPGTAASGEPAELLTLDPAPLELSVLP
jgi:hypothetical protein